MEPQRMDREIEDLVASAQGGDRKSFEALFAGVNARLRKLLQARIGAHLLGKLEVDDALQETLLRAFQSIERFQWRGEDSLFKWLAGIAERVILESARKEQTQRTLELKRDPASRDPSPSKSLRRQERFDRLEKALSCLSPEHREVVLLARRDGLPLKEVAQRVGRSLDATKQILSRALKRLRGSIGGTESLGLPDRALREGGLDHGQR